MRSMRLNGSCIRRCAPRVISQIVVLALFARSPVASAETDDTSSQADRWRTSISVALKAQQQRAEGELSSTLATGVVSPINPTPIPLDAANHDNYFAVIIPIELQLQTPALKLGVFDLAPRVFLASSYQYVPITERDFLVDGKFVPIPPNPTAASQGLGGEIRIDLQHQWSVSAGVAFPVEIAGIPVDIRASLDYMGQWISADAKVIGVQVGTNALIVLESDDSKAIHYLGPRLGIETDAGKAGDTRWVVFAEASTYFSRFAGEQSLRGTSTLGPESARFEYKPDSLLFQIGVGVRVYWEP